MRKLQIAFIAVSALTGCFDDGPKVVDDKRPDKITVMATLVQTRDNGQEIEKKLYDTSQTCNIGNASAFCSIGVEVPNYPGLAGSETGVLVFDAIQGDSTRLAITVKRHSKDVFVMTPDSPAYKGKERGITAIPHTDSVTVPWTELTGENPVRFNWYPKKPALVNKDWWEYRVSAKAVADK